MIVSLGENCTQCKMNKLYTMQNLKQKSLCMLNSKSFTKLSNIVCENLLYTFTAQNPFYSRQHLFRHIRAASITLYHFNISKTLLFS